MSLISDEHLTINREKPIEMANGDKAWRYFSSAWYSTPPVVDWFQKEINDIIVARQSPLARVVDWFQKEINDIPVLDMKDSCTVVDWFQKEINDILALFMRNYWFVVDWFQKEINDINSSITTT